MEKVTTETILTTLFKYGFNEVDPVLYSLVLSEVALENAKREDFDFALDVQVSKSIIKDGLVYRLNEKGIDKDLWFKVHTSDKLYKYLENINFEQIVFKKVKAYKKQVTKAAFSQKEIDIIKNANRKTEDPIVKIIERQEQKRNEMKEIISTHNYIEWLIDFTKKNNNQIYDEDIVDSKDISDEDRKKVNNLSIFLEIISEYAEQYECAEGFFCKIKYNDEVLNIGVLHGLTVVHFVSLASKIDELGNPKIGYDVGATDYNEIVKNYNKYNKPKEYKKTNN